MREESGRSLIEVVGVLAIAGIMTAGTIASYNAIRARTARTVAASEMANVAKNIRLLLENRMDYTGVSVDYLVTAGALKKATPPIGKSWQIFSAAEGAEFVIRIEGLSFGECAYFTTAKIDWADKVSANDTEECNAGDNRVSFVSR
jgi:Tfp pilus assembly protein PilE